MEKKESLTRPETRKETDSSKQLEPAGRASAFCTKNCTLSPALPGRSSSHKNAFLKSSSLARSPMVELAHRAEDKNRILKFLDPARPPMVELDDRAENKSGVLKFLEPARPNMIEPVDRAEEIKMQS